MNTESYWDDVNVGKYNLEGKQKISICVENMMKKSSIKQSLRKTSEKKPCSVIDLISIINCVFSFYLMDFLLYAW